MDALGKLQVLDEERPFLDLDFDPKSSWALRNRQRFPIEVSRAGLALKMDGARIIPFGRQTTDLFAEIVNVRTDDEAAGRMSRRIGSCAGTDELDTLLLVHSSTSPDRHRLLLSYIRLTFRRVSLEMAKFLGFVRFRRVGGNLYYAPVHPDQALIVHDIGGGTAFWSDHGASGIVDLTGLPDDLAARLSRDCDPDIEKLWRTYFTRIANPERRNPRLQRTLMPARYWDLLVERPGSLTRR